MAETRKQLKQRLKGLGRWDEYLSIRAKLTSEGMTAGAARAKAIQLIDERITNQNEAGTGNQPARDALGTITLDVTDAEKTAWQGAATKADESLEDWIRGVLDNAVSKAEETPVTRGALCVSCLRRLRIGSPLPSSCMKCDMLLTERTGIDSRE